MSTIRYRKDNRYELRFYYNGKQYSVYDKNKKELAKKKNKKLKDLKNINNPEKIKTYILNDWYKIWIKTYKEPFIKYDSLLNIYSYFEKHITPKFGKYELGEITSDKLQTYFNELPKNRTKELIMTYFNACLQKATDLDYIAKNPFTLIVKDKKIKNVRPAFSIDQQKQILDYIQNKDKEFYKLIMFYLATGVRRKEALSISKEDFDNNILHIKGTKTEKSDRYIKITPELKELIWTDKNKIFDYREDYVTNQFKSILTKLKISGTLHCLRHSYATNQFYIGTQAKEVQVNMGHSDITITLDVYTNINIKADKTEILRKIKELYNKYYIELQN